MSQDSEKRHRDARIRPCLGAAYQQLLRPEKALLHQTRRFSSAARESASRFLRKKQKERKAARPPLFTASPVSASSSPVSSSSPPLPVAHAAAVPEIRRPKLRPPCSATRRLREGKSSQSSRCPDPSSRVPAFPDPSSCPPPAAIPDPSSRFLTVPDLSLRPPPPAAVLGPKLESPCRPRPKLAPAAVPDPNSRVPDPCSRPPPPATVSDPSSRVPAVPDPSSRLQPRAQTPTRAPPAKHPASLQRLWKAAALGSW
jgi:hypothetical protein